MTENAEDRLARTIHRLERSAARIDMVPMYCGIPITEFEEKEHLIMLCTLFAEGREKYQAKYFTAIRGKFPSYIAGACAAAELFHKPTIWRRIWNKIKSWV